MNGVINIYKEKGYTSFHVVAVLRHFTGEKKIGHTGTLDPDAAGVLPVCIGKATKLVGQLTDTDKTYKAEMLLGRKTDTQDISGKILEEMNPEEVKAKISEKDIYGAFGRLTGEIEQVPPMYSAVKVGGVKLVDAARKGKVIERQTRKATVYGYSDIKIDMENLLVCFSVDCSKGTYIRTICEDIGGMLGIPACLKSLERTRAAGVGIEETITLKQAEEFAGNGTLAEHIIPTDRFLLDFPYVVVGNEAVKRLVFGNYMYSEDMTGEIPNAEIPGERGSLFKEGIFRIYDLNGNFYALYRYDAVDACYKCEKMFS